MKTRVLALTLLTTISIIPAQTESGVTNTQAQYSTIAALSAARDANEEEGTHWAASLEQIRQAPCQARPDQGGYADSEIWSRLEDLSKKNPESGPVRIGNHSFENANYFLASKYELLLNPTQGEQNSFVIKNERNCKDLRCSLEENFGESTGPRLLYLLAKFGFNGSDRDQGGLMGTSTQSWSAENLDDVIAGAESLPPQLLPLRLTNKPLLRRSAFGRKTLANAYFMFFDLWATYEVEIRIYAVIHEIGHNIQSELDLNGSPWDKLSAWTLQPHLDEETQKPTNVWHSDLPESLVSGYAKTNPSEDFAESFSAYRFNPTRLKRISPDKYEFLRSQVFMGFEYTDSAACELTSSQAGEKFARALDELNSDSFKKEISQLQVSSTDVSECGEAFLGLLQRRELGENLDGASRNCLGRWTVAHLLKRNDVHPRLARLTDATPWNALVLESPTTQGLVDWARLAFQNSLRAGFEMRRNHTNIQIGAEVKKGNISQKKYCNHFTSGLYAASTRLTTRFLMPKRFSANSFKSISTTLIDLGQEACLNAQKSQSFSVSNDSPARALTTQELMSGLEKAFTKW
jgi:hypothetical protein